MAQRSNPARRIPGNPLAGILRSINQQSRYSQRRRSGIPTVTTPFAVAQQDAQAEAEALAVALQFVAPAEVLTEEHLDALRVADTAAFQEDVAVASPVAASQVFDAVAATVVTDDTGAATFTYGPYDVAPVVTATPLSSVAAVATVETLDGVAATVRVFSLAGARLSGVTVHVTAFVPDQSQ